MLGVEESWLEPGVCENECYLKEGCRISNKAKKKIKLAESFGEIVSLVDKSGRVDFTIIEKAQKTQASHPFKQSLISEGKKSPEYKGTGTGSGIFHPKKGGYHIIDKDGYTVATSSNPDDAEKMRKKYGAFYKVVPAGKFKKVEEETSSLNKRDQALKQRKYGLSEERTEDATPRDTETGSTGTIMTNKTVFIPFIEYLNESEKRPSIDKYLLDNGAEVHKNSRMHVPGVEHRYYTGQDIRDLHKAIIDHGYEYYSNEKPNSGLSIHRYSDPAGRKGGVSINVRKGKPHYIIIDHTSKLDEMYRKDQLRDIAKYHAKQSDAYSTAGQTPGQKRSNKRKARYHATQLERTKTLKRRISKAFDNKEVKRQAEIDIQNAIKHKQIQ